MSTHAEAVEHGHGPEAAHEVNAAQVREHPVHDQEVELAGQRPHQRPPAVGLRLDGVALLCEDSRDQARKPLLILYDQYPHGQRIIAGLPPSGTATHLLCENPHGSQRLFTGTRSRLSERQVVMREGET